MENQKSTAVKVGISLFLLTVKVFIILFFSGNLQAIFRYQNF